MIKGCAVFTALALVAIFAASCPECSLPTSTVTPTGENVNFRFLISDEFNAIGDFRHLNVSVSSIGVHRSGASGNWTEMPLNVTVDLTELQGQKATEIWGGNLTVGNYTKVFIHVSNVTYVRNVTANPAEGNQTVNVKVPSNKLQISRSFVVTEDSVTWFVYDITVVRAGKSGKYILKPQIAQSGAYQEFEEV